MKFIKIKITIEDDASGQLVTLDESFEIRRVIPERWVPADCMPDIVSNTLSLLKDPMVAFYTKHRN